MEINADSIDLFRAFIWDFYRQNKRSFMWRNTQDPYAIVVSEIMLQQTQTHRVEQKYEQFMAAFTSFEQLAQSSLYDVLSAWQGLGYNRRGKYLHQIAVKVMEQYDGVLPDNPEVLVSFPGIGPATASSICAFAFNSPTVFIETNIRAVFIDSFFYNCTDVHDKELLPLIAATVDVDNPREWYYALMDYGVFLKKMGSNPSRKSKHHAKQSCFEGSDRQLRGAIIRILVAHRMLKQEDLTVFFPTDSARILVIVEQLIKEGFIVKKNNVIQIA